MCHICAAGKTTFIKDFNNFYARTLKLITLRRWMCAWVSVRGCECLAIYYVGANDWNNMALYSCLSVDTDIISVLLDKHHCGSPKPPRSYFALESQVVYRPHFSLCLVLLGNGETKDDVATANYWAAKKTSFVTNMSLFNGRKYRTILLHNSRTENEISNTHKQTLHWKDISKLSLASNIHHSYVAQHRSHGCATKFPILTLANTSLKRIKFVYTPKNKKAGIPISCCF